MSFCLAYFNYHNVFKVYLCCSMYQNFFLRLSNIPLYVYATFCLSIHWLMDTWVASTFQLLWIMPLWTWVYKYLFKSLLSIVLSIYLGMELLNHKWFYKFWGNCHNVLHSSCTILHSHKQCTSIPVSPHSCQHLLFSVSLITTILMGMKWYLIVVLVWISLMINDVEHLFICLYKPFLC